MKLRADHDLERDTVTAALQSLHAMRAQRDELLAALKRLCTATYHMRDDATATRPSDFPGAHAAARDVIAKVQS